MVIASGIAGELGITPRHAPLITQLKAGPVRIQKADGEEAAARAAKAEAERQLADRTGEMEVAEAQSQLMQAVAQLAALEHLRKNIKR